MGGEGGGGDEWGWWGVVCVPGMAPGGGCLGGDGDWRACWAGAGDECKDGGGGGMGIHAGWWGVTQSGLVNEERGGGRLLSLHP